MTRLQAPTMARIHLASILSPFLLFDIIALVDFMSSKRKHISSLSSFFSHILKRAMNQHPIEAITNQSVLLRFQEMTNDFPLGFTVSPAHITPAPNSDTPLTHPPTANSLPSGEAVPINHRDRSMPLIGLLHKAV